MHIIYKGLTIYRGMPATVSIGSDRYAESVTELLSPKRIKVGGMIWSLRKDGRWRPKGCGHNSGYGLTLGHAEDYRDPSF